MESLMARRVARSRETIASPPFTSPSEVISTASGVYTERSVAESPRTSASAQVTLVATITPMTEAGASVEAGGGGGGGTGAGSRQAMAERSTRNGRRIG